jgi:hypothetical protein
MEINVIKTATTTADKGLNFSLISEIEKNRGSLFVEFK